MPTKTSINIKEGASSISSTNNRRPSDLNSATDLVELSKQLNTSNQNTTVAKSPNDNTTTKEEEQGVVPPQDHPPIMSNEQGNNNYDAEKAEAAAAAASAGEHDGINGITGIKDADIEKTAFPILLHDIVSDPSTDDCIHWLSCGTRFMISDKKKFAKEVLPRFYGHAKFTSFTRRLKRWSFTRVPSGPFMGAYFNPNFRRGEPEMASRVRYDHPTPLSGAAMQLNKAKLQALGAGGYGAAAGMMGMSSAYGMAPPQMSLEEREALLRSMGMMQPGMAMMQQPQGVPGGGNNLDSLYRSMAQQQNNGMPGGGGGNGQQQGQGQAVDPNLAATNNTVAFQMAMAQEMMQQRQRQAMMGNNMMGMQQNPQGLLDMLKQQQGQVSNPNMQQQGGGQQQPGQQGNSNFFEPSSSMPSLVSLTNNSASGISSNFHYNNNQGQQGMVGGGDSGGSLSMGAAPSSSDNNNAPQLNFNAGMGMAGGQASNNPTAMNALLADYLNRQQQGGGGGGDVKQEGGAQQVNNGGGDNQPGAQV